jgi:DNA polymerase-3 subunit delta
MQDQLKACQIADYFASNTRKNPMIMIVAVLYGFYAKLFALASASSKGESGAANALKINTYAMKDYTVALNKYPVRKLEECVLLIKEADLKLKGVNAGSSEEGQILKELVLRLLR